MNNIAIYLFQDLAIPFGVNMLQHTNTNRITIQGQQLAIEQINDTKQDPQHF